ncbi:MAG: hypothetical protein MK135_15725 [Polyangiaceae bacterium]|nr:hypothetical protein [Polyangiaceae bacterium]
MAGDDRFGDIKAPHPVEWLSDNGPQFVANETRKFAAACDLLPRITRPYSPDSTKMVADKFGAIQATARELTPNQSTVKINLCATSIFKRKADALHNLAPGQVERD